MESPIVDSEKTVDQTNFAVYILDCSISLWKANYIIIGFGIWTINLIDLLDSLIDFDWLTVLDFGWGSHHTTE